MKGDHVEDLSPCRAGGSLVHVEADLPIRPLQRQDVVVGGIRGQHQRLALGFESVDHMPRGMAESGDGVDPRHHLGTVGDESGLFRQRHDLLQHRLVAVLGRRADAGRILPEVELHLSGHIAGVREGRRAALHEAADMIAVHMGDDDDRNLLGRIAGGANAVSKFSGPRLPAAFAEPGVEQHDLRSGIDQDRRKAVDETGGRQEILFEQRRDGFHRLIGAIGLVRIVRGARPIADHRHLEGTELEGLESRILRHGVLFCAFLSIRNSGQEARRRQGSHPCPEQGSALQTLCDH